MQLITRSEKQTIALGKKIASKLKGGEVLALTGDLGAGKTTLAKGIALGLNIKKTIASPTFVLMKVYKVNSKLINKLVHIDCYRINDAEEIKAIGATEYFGQPNTVVLIEWPERIKKILPGQTRPIKLRLIKENLREITILY